LTSASLWDRLVDDFLAPLRAAHEEQRAYLASPAAQHFDLRTAGTLVVAAVMLTLQEYVFASFHFGAAVDVLRAILPSSVGQQWAEWASGPATTRIAGLTWWAVGQTLIYLVIPALFVKFVVGDRLRDYGLKLRGAFQSAWVYALMYLAMIGPVLWASRWQSFLNTYPFYQVEPGASFWPRMLYWEILYAIQFIALEFFFRGFILHGCRRRFGAYAIFVMAVPYCMIHFHKPLLETLGAIAAGLILGYMSLRTRSIWLGAALHVAVAWTMDAAALMQQRATR
jgi:membrane protease YdiL (CAAX protease family)